MKQYLRIDFELFKDKRLNQNDIILLAYFSSFEKCFTNNETLKEIFGITERMAQYSITKLKKLNYIKVKNNKKHKRREIVSTLETPTGRKKKIIDAPNYLKHQESEELTEEEKTQAEELSKKLLGK